MTTKYANFILMQNKAETDLAEVITTLCAKLGRSPRHIFCDQESGIIPIAKKGHWQINDK